MNFAYKLEHKRLLEIDSDGDRVCATKLLGFFSSEEKCRAVVSDYLKLPGFKDYPDDFVTEKVSADIDDYNYNIGDFGSSVFYLEHEWYDGEYDYVTGLGYYSSMKAAENATALYRLETEFSEHPDGFAVGEFKIDKRESGWEEGFSTY